MTAILDICKVTYTSGQGANGAGGTSVDYYFKTTHGVYVAGNAISDATGITAEGADQDWSIYPLTTVKELLRASVIYDIKVKVSSGNGGSSNAATKTYTKGLHYADSKADTVEDALADAPWPVGKGADGTIQDVFTPRRVVSRR